MSVDIKILGLAVALAEHPRAEQILSNHRASSTPAHDLARHLLQNCSPEEIDGAVSVLNEAELFQAEALKQR